MSGIDLIEALDFLDAEYVQDARNFQRHIPSWLKWVSVAACICCLLLVGGLSLQHIFKAVSLVPDSEALASVTFDEDDCEIITSKTGLSMAVPVAYLDDFDVDLTYTHTVEGDPIHRELIFAFNDEYNRASGGFVWGIYAQSAQEWTAQLQEGQTESMDSLYFTPIGRSGDQVYTLAYYSPLLSEPEQYDPASCESVSSYYQHMENGLLMLEDFLARNQLEPVNEWWDWQDYYQRKLLKPLEVQLENLQQSDDDAEVLLSEYYGVTLEVPAKYAGEFVVDACFTSYRTEYDILNDMAFGFYDNTNQNTEGFVWGIYAHFTPEKWDDYVESGDADTYYSFDYTVLGQREKQTCVLVYYPTDPTDNGYLQYDPESYESVNAYYEHLVAGYHVLDDFVQRNGLTEDLSHGDWQELYQKQLLKPLEILLEELEDESNPTPLLWSYSGELNIIEDCMEYSENQRTMTLFDPITREILGYGGNIFWLEALSYEEYTQFIADDPVAEPFEDGWYGSVDPCGFVFARDEEHYYILNTPTDLQYDPLDTASSSSYLTYMEASMEILESVISLNDLTCNPHWGEEFSQKLFYELFQNTPAA